MLLNACKTYLCTTAIFENMQDPHKSADTSITTCESQFQLEVIQWGYFWGPTTPGGVNMQTLHLEGWLSCCPQDINPKINRQMSYITTEVCGIYGSTVKSKPTFSDLCLRIVSGISFNFVLLRNIVCDSTCGERSVLGSAFSVSTGGWRLSRVFPYPRLSCRSGDRKSVV